jgi:hypothetical protein
MTQIGVGGAAREQVRIFLQVAGKHRERLLFALGQRDHLLDAVRPIRLAAEVIDHHHARVLQHVFDIEIDRCRLPQIRDVREPHAGKALAQPGKHACEQ